MRLGLGIIALLLVSVATVHAGVLIVEHFEGNGTRVTAVWKQGAGTTTVRYLDGRVYERNMTIDSGPNGCFAIGADGNDHAIYLPTTSDASGPVTPDAIVDCQKCGCENTPNTRYRCTNDGSCAACDPCAGDACGTGNTCLRISCSQKQCSCDPVACSGYTCSGTQSLVKGCGTGSLCSTTRTCVAGQCGAQCSTGSQNVTAPTCDGNTLVTYTKTCGSTCGWRTVSRTIIQTCSAGCSKGACIGGAG